MLPDPLHEKLRRLYQEAGTDTPLPGDPYWTEFSRLREEEKQTVRVVRKYLIQSNYLPGVPKKEIEKKAEKMLPEGVNLIAGGAKRIGEPARTATIERLQEAFANGEIPEAELDARVNAAIKSVVKEDLDLLVRDLEPAREGVKNTDIPEIIKPARRSRAAVSGAFCWAFSAFLLSSFGSAYGDWPISAIGSLLVLACTIWCVLNIFRKSS